MHIELWRSFVRSGNAATEVKCLETWNGSMIFWMFYFIILIIIERTFFFPSELCIGSNRVCIILSVLFYWRLRLFADWVGEYNISRLPLIPPV